MYQSGLGTTLKKLSKGEGDWVLEVERLVPFGRQLHQPLSQKIEGAELIGKHMRAVPELAAMAEQTEALMGQDEAAECYEIWQGAWVEQEMVHALSLQKAKTSSEGVVRSAPAGGASRKAVAKLEIQQEKLVEQLNRLEHGDTGALAEQVDRLGEILSTFATRLAAIEGKLGMEVGETPDLPAAFANTPDPVTLAHDEDSEDSTNGDDVVEASADDESDNDGDKENRPDKRMRPPSVVAMRQSLTMLVGEEVALLERKDRVDLDDEGGAYFRCLVNDDSGVLLGVMVADLEATVRLASQLLMLPDGETKSQLATGEATEETVETMSEIFNTMSTTINNVKNNPHVRTMPLEALEPGELEWLAGTKRRVDVDVEGGGVIVVAAI